MKRKPLLIAALVAFSAASAWSFTVSVNTKMIGFVAGRTSGHEEITRQAMNRLEPSLLAAGIDEASFVPEFLGARGANPFGTKGFSVDNKIIQGNYATDFPEALVKVFDLAAWHGEVPGGWTTNPNVQVLHFLQNRRPDGALVPQLENCNAAREQIVRSTQEGVRLWRSGERGTALFLFGHATHTIQDSFSAAHTIRADRNNNHNVLKVCYYDVFRPTADSCYHLPVDPRDGIWIRTPGQLLLAKNESLGESAAIVPYVPVFTDFMLLDSFKESALKHEARLARTATMRYLYLVAMYLKNPGPDDDFSRLRKILMENLFEGSTGMRAVDQGLPKADDARPIPMAEGIIRCDKLDAKAATTLPTEEEVKNFERWGAE
jgi:hypothetical protein